MTMTNSPQKRTADSTPASATKKRPSDITLDSATLGDLVAYKKAHHPQLAREVVCFDHTETVGNALEQLSKQHIMAAPVRLAPSLEDHDEGAYLGIVDSQCLLEFITSMAKDAQATQAKAGQPATKHAYLGDVGADFLGEKLIKVCGNDTGFSFGGPQLQKSLREVLTTTFLDAEKPVHRIMLSDPKGMPTGLITQSDVVQFVAAHPACCGAVLDMTIADLGLDGLLVCVDQNMAAIEAFERMIEQKVSSVGVINAKGVLVGNLSASDLKGMGWSDMKLLSLPVARFLMIEGFKKHEDEFTTLQKAQRQRQKKLPVYSCKSTDTLYDVLQQIIAHRVHRVYVVDDAGVATGIVTLTDILNVITAN